MLSYLARRALTAAIIAAAGAAGTMVARRYFERRSTGRVRHDDRVALNRWEDEGGAPVEVAVPTSDTAVRGAAPL